MESKTKNKSVRATQKVAAVSEELRAAGVPEEKWDVLGELAYQASELNDLLGTLEVGCWIPDEVGYDCFGLGEEVRDRLAVLHERLESELRLPLTAFHGHAYEKSKWARKLLAWRRARQVLEREAYRQARAAASMALLSP